MWIDIKKYLGIPLTSYEHPLISITLISYKITKQYNLLPLVRKKFVYLDILKVMYVFPQVGRLSNDLLAERLTPKECFQCTHPQGLWCHKWLPILFSLVVYDLSVKYVSKEHSNHSITVFWEFYPVAEDWNGILHWDIILNRNDQKRTVDRYMPWYVSVSLHKYQHTTEQRKQHCPHKKEQTIYGVRQQI